MDSVTHFQFSHVHFNELWQIFSQAAYFGFSENVGNDTAAQFNAWGDVCIDKVEWHFNVDFFCGANALEVHVLDGVTHWVHLEVT